MLSAERSGQPRGSDRRRTPPSRPVRRSRARPDVVALASLAILVLLGLLNLHALGAQSLVDHQMITVLAGVAVFVGMRRLRSDSLRWFGWTCYWVSVVLLAVVGVVGDAGLGARRWLTLGSFTLQPSELAKIGLLLVLAQVLGTDRAWPRRLGLAVVLAAVPIGLVVAEPDLSTATVLTATTLVMLVLGRIPIRVIVVFAGAAALAAPLAEQLLQPYQLERLHAFLSGSRSASGAGWTIQQAHIALAWGGVNGQPDHTMNLVLAQYLPARETDLAYASLVEQWGIRAGLLAVLAAGALVWRVAVASRHARTRPAALSAAGFAVLIGIEVVVSVGANLGLVPTAGVPFPLLSYGGTAAAAHIAMAGMVLGLRAEAVRHRLWILPSWRRIHPRLVRLTAVAVIAGLIAMTGFLWNLQRSRGPELRAAGVTQMTRCVRIPAPRGPILDRHGVTLAADVAQDEIWVVPGVVDSAALERVAAIAALPATRVIRAAAARRSGPTVTVATVPAAIGRRVTAAHLPGVIVVASSRRHYPYGALLGPVLGWAGVATPEDMQRWPNIGLGAIVGRAGIEQQYDPVLRGTDGEQCVYVDPAGVPVAAAPSVAPVPGLPLRLTIDLGLQQKLTSALRAALRPGADLGAGVSLDPRNGQVLAMASLPSYDDNLFGPPVDDAALTALYRRAGHPMLQHVTQVEAPPGSTFKLAVAAADMVHRVLPPDVVVPTGGSWTLAGHTFHNWSVLPPQDLTQAIAWSNDVYFYKLAWALGPSAMISAAKSLGVGRTSGIDLPGEYHGFLGTPSTVHEVGGTWYPGSTVLLGIGQGYLTVTPLQDALWTAAVSTGSLVTPHLGLAVGSRSGRFTALRWPAPRRLPFAGRLGPVRAGMRAAVTSGTASMLSSLSAPAGGKTGTAEDPTAPGAGTDSWLSAVAPLRAPVVETTVFLHGGSGHEDSTPPVQAALAYFLAHQKAVLAGP